MLIVLRCVSCVVDWCLCFRVRSCSLFVVRCMLLLSLFDVLFVVLLFGVRNCLFVVCVSLVVCWLLVVVCCSMFVVRGTCFMCCL